MTSSKTKIEKIVSEFKGLSDWTQRYRTIISRGRSLSEMPAVWKVDSNKVKGCQSSVWLFAQMREGKVYFSADSDAAIVKGLVSILVDICSGLEPSDILKEDFRFVEELGLNTHLSQTRVNGLVAMIKQIQFYAMAFETLKERGVLNS